ncbi:PucR family transcriptional regulator [Streptomyces sp. NA02950]|uniref:PucR family transcriptional regulator n=1 Tax=Streptomyces sp. NA02950 TaxID=2742137 RepID=UPI00159269CB|nr:PucR family transcriptional regulator [Streptomyces sp. NA02950]QKV92285.1 PucR family transcriptional regulator [Streptomyces sp. NA02950]
MRNDRVPPTAPVPLSALLTHPALGLRQVAGPREPETWVYLVHTSEMEDPVPYLLGGELLLSAGVHTPDPEGTDDSWDRYVSRTVQAGAAALGFGIAPVHQTVPRALAEACDRHGLPLVEVERRTTFTAVASAVWDAMAERRHHELRRITEAQQSLATAAARPHPVPEVLRRLSRHLGGWTVLHGPDGAELADAGPRPPQPARSALEALAARLRPGPSSAADTAADADGAPLYLSAYGLGQSERRLALGVCAPRRDAADGTNGADRAVVGLAVVLLALLTGRRTVTAETARTAALVRLMLGAAPDEVAGLVRRSLTGAGAEEPAGDEDGGAWTVVRGRRRGRAGDAGPLAAAALAAGLGTPLIDLAGDELCALVPGEGEVRAQPGWTLGAAAPVRAGELARGADDADRALRRAVAGRTPVVRHAPDRAGGVASLVDPAEAGAHGRALLAPLEDSPALLETLRVWLSLHGSWDRTAVALEVHRNTVRQRIARAAALLGADLADADVRMELWFALKWR